jgi:Patatin-like phospholipase
LDKKTTDRKTLNEVLAAELNCLRPSHGLYQTTPQQNPAPRDASIRAEPPSYKCSESDIDQDLKRVFRQIGNWSKTRRLAAKTPGDENDRSDTPPRGDAATPAPLCALCLSGGGIRSATFNLGVLQALAKVDLLGKFDYLSSVSGGGYIASWLRAWMHRDGVSDVVAKLKSGGRCSPALAPEPVPVSTLRDYSNYLTPVVGLFSGDTWSAAATILRNLLLNWLVLLPIIGAVVGVPLLFLLFIHTPSMSEPVSSILIKLALGIEIIASALVYSMRRFAKRGGISQGRFIWTCVVPICVAAGALSAAALGAHLPGTTQQPGTSASWAQVWEFCAAWCIAVPCAGWLTVEGIVRCSKKARIWATGIKTDTKKKPSPDQLAAQVRSVPFWQELAALAVSGIVGMCLLVGTVKWWFGFLMLRPALYTVFVLPILLGVYLIARVIFIGMASISDEDPVWKKGGSKGREPSDVRNRIYRNDSDREWWSRLSGWILLVVVCWTIVTSICLLGCYLPDNLAKLLGFLQSGTQAGSEAIAAAHTPNTGQGDSVASLIRWIIGALGGVSGLIAALAGSDSRTPATSAVSAPPAPKSTTRLLAISGPLFVVCLIMTLSWSVKAIAESIISSTPLIYLYSPPVPAHLFDFKMPGQQDLPWPITLAFLGVLLSLALLGLRASRFVNVNRFSLHGMYRNRLVRAYLGASNCNSAGQETRIADPFTGFALTDNFPLHKLCEPGADSQLKACAPLSIINTTLNLVKGEKLAWQQRKAASFSMTPLFCGNWSTGYRTSEKYGGPDGITVGTAMTISGAAANPNMGYCSSPVLGFLMAMFNLRLGAWLGNTNDHGDKTYEHPGPRQALLSLLAEMFGMTNSCSHYVNLSDGGHFDNLGLYEAVLRRCRYVLVSDAGRDKDFTFEDLGNSIRKIRIDFGINIQFDTIRILDNSSTEHGVCCALARIRYSDVDGTSADDDGLLVYIKPTLRGVAQMPYDVYSYSKFSREFPHESTADQWFNESQFESYRALGWQIGNQLTERLVTHLHERWPKTQTESLSAATLLEHLYSAMADYIRSADPEKSATGGAVPTPLRVTLRAPKVVLARN